MNEQELQKFNEDFKNLVDFKPEIIQNIILSNYSPEEKPEELKKLFKKLLVNLKTLWIDSSVNPVLEDLDKVINKYEEQKTNHSNLNNRLYKNLFEYIKTE